MMWNGYQLSWFGPLCVVTGLMLFSLGLVLLSRWCANNVDRDARWRRDKAPNTAWERVARGEITPGEFDAPERGLNP